MQTTQGNPHLKEIHKKCEYNSQMDTNQTLV